jgi:hypothetical protein
LALANQFLDIISSTAAATWISGTYTHPVINSSITVGCTIDYTLENSSDTSLVTGNSPIGYTSASRIITFKA